ncbi:homeobox-leucine zipper protein REVOLUTA-like isoform X2 [Silene latifolia]|uniref:homeobox-leucine zipper protein REVOLUTA-like isoform X2 n=1 Tax=Silene latifolia TaxID=37657 RepID=UPI003D770ADE
MDFSLIKRKEKDGDGDIDKMKKGEGKGGGKGKGKGKDGDRGRGGDRGGGGRGGRGGKGRGKKGGGGGVSGFRDDGWTFLNRDGAENAIPLDGHSHTAEDAYKSEDIHLFQGNPTNRTLDLISSPVVGPPTNQGASDATFFGSTHSVLTIIFQLPFVSNLPESFATMARQYVSSVISSVQRVAMAISPSDLTPTVGPKLSPGSPEALTLVHWICNIYSCLGKGFYCKTQTDGRCNSFMALHYGLQIAQETSGEVVYGLGWQPTVLRTFSGRLNRFNDASDGFSDDGWTLLNCDGTEEAKPFIATLNGANLLPVVVLLCAKASMLLQNVPPTVLVRLLREHRFGWDDVSVDAYSDAALKGNSYAFPRMRATRFSRSQIIMPLDHTIEHEEDNLTIRTIDFTLGLEVGPPTNQGALDATASGRTRSVFTITFQLPFDSNLQDSVISSVQSVAMAITPSCLTPTVGPKLSVGSLESLTLVHWICKSYCCHMGTGLLQHLLLLIKQY